MVADETTMRLIDLAKYEASRASPISDEVYRANANLLMHDEPVYRCGANNCRRGSTRGQPQLIYLFFNLLHSDIVYLGQHHTN
jgi:hypothetical protein